MFLLREVFDYPYDEIAEIVGARGRDAASSPCAPAARWTERQPAVRVLARAARASSRASSSPPPRRATSRSLEELLAADVDLHGDGGGKARPSLARSAAATARTLVAWARAAPQFGGFTERRTRVNGGQGAVFLAPDGRVSSDPALEIAGGRSAASTRSSTPTSSGTSSRWPTSVSSCGAERQRP